MASLRLGFVLAVAATLAACTFGDDLFGPKRGTPPPQFAKPAPSPGSLTGQMQSLTDDLKHQQQDLQQIQKQTNDSLAKVNAMLDLLNKQIDRQAAEATARASAPSAPAPAAAPRQSASASAPPSPAPVEAAGDVRRPLVVLHFDQPNPDYAPALYTALSGALERRPAANFDVVAVGPPARTAEAVAANADASKRNLEKVVRSIAEMGMPPERLTLSATTSADVASSEVRIYVR